MGGDGMNEGKRMILRPLLYLLRLFFPAPNTKIIHLRFKSPHINFPLSGKHPFSPFSPPSPSSCSGRRKNTHSSSKRVEGGEA